MRFFMYIGNTFIDVYGRIAIDDQKQYKLTALRQEDMQRWL